jgi:tRNA(adenine34) deaminase
METVQSKNEFYMKEALKEAQKAEDIGEIPIGAIIVKDEKIVGRGYNKRETEKVSLYHAEIIAIENACKTLGGWRLTDCELYVTIEPCVMCAGAIYQSRISKVYFGAFDKKAGAFGSLYDFSEDDRLNHLVKIENGLLHEECSQMIKLFFKKLRSNKKSL